MLIEARKCLRCGHKWIPRTDAIPLACPACKSYAWQTKLSHRRKPLRLKGWHTDDLDVDDEPVDLKAIIGTEGLKALKKGRV